MKKILLVGKLNKTTKELYEGLSRRFQVQLSAEPMEIVQGMMQIVNPDMALISVMELEDIETEVFELLEKAYKNVPVLVVGTKEGCDKYQEYFSNKQFKKLLRPVGKDILLQSCYQILGVKDTFAETDKASVTENGTKRILIVDDSPVTLRSIKAMLDKKYEISVATSGEQALKTMQKERPDLVLLDYEMPGLNGKETLERIRENENLCDIPVIFLTGVADKEHISAVLKLNPAGYFLKPAEREKLIATIEDVLFSK